MRVFIRIRVSVMHPVHNRVSAGAHVCRALRNESEDIKKMIALGVDGIISDYPDRVINLVRKQNSFSAKNRNEITGQLKNTSFDLLVIGGGITGGKYFNSERTCIWH